MNTYLFIFVCVTAIALIWLGMSRLVKMFVVGPALKDKDATLNTPLSAFREASAYDNLVGATSNVPASISQAYEEMCIFRPETYYLDPTLDKVIQDYKALLQGKILDPEGKHIPSETIEGNLNPDYRRYLKSQIRVLGKAGKDVTWFKKELKRFNDVDKEELFEGGFLLTLEEMGAPEYLLDAMIKNGRMESYKPEDWKALIAQLKVYVKTYHPAAIIYFLEEINDKEILLDEAKMDAFVKLRDLDISNELAAAYVRSDVSEEDLEAITGIMNEEYVSSEEALKLLLERKKAALTADILRETYRQKVASK